MTGRARLLALFSLVLLTLLPRLPLIDDPVDLKPDGCEYLGIARHLARDGSWLSSIKWHFFNEAPPLHPALADRPPLYPLLASVVWRLTDRPTEQLPRSRTAIRAVRVVNVGLAALGTALAYLLLELRVPWPAALGAAALLALYPSWMRDSAQPLTEPLYMVLWLGALWIFYSRRETVISSPRAVLVGVMSGLAYLTRPSGLMLPLFFSLALLPPLAGKPAPRALLPLWAGFILTWAPYGAALARETGSPFTSILSYNFSIRHIYEGTLYGFERAFPRPMEFVTARPTEVAALIAGQTGVLLSALGRSLRFLLPLVVFLRAGDLRRHSELWLLAAINFAFHAVAWTVWGAGRYLLPTYLLVAALLLAAPLARAAQATDLVRRRAFGAAAAVAWIAALAACLAGDARLHREKARPNSGVRMGWAYQEAATWLRAEAAGREDAVASNQPWILNLLAERPARMAPRFRDEAQAGRFSDRYPARWLVFFAEEAEDFAAMAVIAPRHGSGRKVSPALRDTWQMVRYAERPVPWGETAAARRPRPPAAPVTVDLGDVTAMLLLRRR